MARAFQEYFCGYGQDPEQILQKTFEETNGYDEMAVLKGIPFQSHCEHHVAPIIGRAWVAYVPNARVVGISKLARVVEAYAKRLQIQERLTAQVANTIEHVLKPKEGGLGWVDTWMISSGADSERVELAHAWVNHFLDKKNYVTVVRSTGYGGTVDVRDQLTPDEIELYFQNRSDEASQLHMFDQPSSPEKWERIWSDVEAS